MALQVQYQSQYGFLAPVAYVRIEKFRGTKTSIFTEVQYFYDSAAKDSSQPIGYAAFDLPLANGATMAEMYTALKSLPEFANAIDC